MNDLAATPIEYLKGVGPQKAILLKKTKRRKDKKTCSSTLDGNDPSTR